MTAKHRSKYRPPTLALLVGLAAVLATLLVWGASVWSQPLTTMAAFKAKTFAAGVFLQGLDLARLEAEDTGFNAAGRYFPVSVDRGQQRATASLLGTGLFAATAVRVQGLGVVLLAGRSEAEVRALGANQPVVTASPWTLKLDNSAIMKRAVAELLRDNDPDQPVRTRAVVVAHHGKLVAEAYADGIGRETPLVSFSMAKSVTALLVGAVVAQGKLDVHKPAPVPAWTDGRAAITTDHLLRMTSGLAWHEEYNGNLASDVDRMLMLEPDHAAFAASKPLLAAPGKVFSYSSGSTDLVSGVLRTALADDKAYWTLPTRALFGPLGLASAEWSADASGTFVGSASLYASARDWARLGQLVLQDGVWNGKRLLPAGWIAYLTTADASNNGFYGASFWLNSGRPRAIAAMPPDLVFLQGYNGQFVFICPSLDVVVVRLGMTWEGAPGPDYDTFFTLLRKALREEDA